jgi:hypothetical protein
VSLAVSADAGGDAGGDAASVGSTLATGGKARLSKASTRRNRSAMMASRSASFRCNVSVARVTSGDLSNKST